MTGETDLAAMLASLRVDRRPGSYAIVTSADGAIDPLQPVALAMVAEPEGTTLVVPFESALAAGFDPEFEAAWLTLAVHSSLDAVGLTAEVARRLAAVSIPCNVLAGYFHDHLLVPVSRTADALTALVP